MFKIIKSLRDNLAFFIFLILILIIVSILTTEALSELNLDAGIWLTISIAGFTVLFYLIRAWVDQFSSSYIRFGLKKKEILFSQMGPSIYNAHKLLWDSVAQSYRDVRIGISSKEGISHFIEAENKMKSAEANIIFAENEITEKWYGYYQQISAFQHSDPNDDLTEEFNKLEVQYKELLVNFKKSLLDLGPG